MFKVLPKKVWIPILIAVIVILVGGVFAYQYWWLPREEAKNQMVKNEVIPKEETGNTASPSFAVPNQDETEILKDKNKSFCDTINNESAKYSCYECDRMNRILKETCYQALARSQKNIFICDQINSQGSKDRCYGYLAVDTQDLSICDQIISQAPKNDCYKSIALFKQDLFICDKIQDQDIKDDCYFNIANAKLDLSICDRIQDFAKYPCYWKIALAKQDLSICDRTQNKEDCYSSIAEAKQELSICDKIKNQEIKDNCYRFANRRETEKIIKDRATEAILVIKNKNQEKLSNLAHPDKGIRFSPYSFIDKDSDLVFFRPQLLKFFEDQKVYGWGFYDGSGIPVDLTPLGYYKDFIYDVNFIDAPEIGYNKIIGGGNTMSNVFESYPDSIVVEYHFSGFDQETYGGMDWRSLRLVFEEKDNTWYLVGIIHDEWTI